MRKIALGVYDYRGNKLIDLYSNMCSYLGVAYDVELHHELAGNKELTFTIPMRILDPQGKWMENPRRAYLKNEYNLSACQKSGIRHFFEYCTPSLVERRSRSPGRSFV